jgi:hypothetical protein
VNPLTTVIINLLKGAHSITGYKYDKVFILEFIKSLKEKGLSTSEIYEAIKELYL